MKNERKQIILQALAQLLEKRNPSKITTALLAKESKITELHYIVIFLASEQSIWNYLIFVMFQFERKYLN